jgi:hypothetical protein
MDAKDGKETKRATYLAGDSGKDDVRALVVLVVSTRLEVYKLAHVPMHTRDSRV